MFTINDNNYKYARKYVNALFGHYKKEQRNFFITDFYTPDTPEYKYHVKHHFIWFYDPSVLSGFGAMPRGLFCHSDEWKSIERGEIKFPSFDEFIINKYSRTKGLYPPKKGIHRIIINKDCIFYIDVEDGLPKYYDTLEEIFS